QLNLMLSGTQLGVTLTALGLGALGEPTLAHELSRLFVALPPPLHTIATHAVATVVAFILITFLEVVIGEMVPKNLALTRPEGIALAVAAPLRTFIAVLRPLIWLIERSSRAVLHRLGIKSLSVSSAHTPGELALIVEESRRGGSIEPGQSELLTRSLEFPERRSVEAMVPRVSVVAIPATATSTSSAPPPASSPWRTSSRSWSATSGTSPTATSARRPARCRAASGCRRRCAPTSWRTPPAWSCRRASTRPSPATSSRSSAA